MAEGKHTELPWEIVDSDMMGEYLIYPDNNYAGHIAEVHGENTKANAELIVQAVNSHAALVEACEMAAIQSCSLHGIEPSPNCDYCERIEKAQAALALANKRVDENG